MSELPIQKLTEHFLQFPGIGPRQARRFVYYLLQADQALVNDFIRYVAELKKSVRRCPECGRFTTVCKICSDPNRDPTSLMVVEKDIDLENVERAGVFRGRYFVLGGLVSLLDTASLRLPLAALREKTERQSKNQGLKEVILALSANPEGDQTAATLKETLAPLVKKYGLRLTVFGRGLSTGAELEYSDGETLKNAFKNRA